MALSEIRKAAWLKNIINFKRDTNEFKKFRGLLRL